MMILSCPGNPTPVCTSQLKKGKGELFLALQKGSSFCSLLLFGFPCPRNRMADKMRYNVPSAAVATATRRILAKMRRGECEHSSGPVVARLFPQTLSLAR